MALLYCFLNGEVQQELMKFWRNRVVSGRQSRPHPTHSLTFHSVVTQSVPLPHLLAKTNSDPRVGGGQGLTKKKVKVQSKAIMENPVQETSLA